MRNEKSYKGIIKEYDIVPKKEYSDIILYFRKKIKTLVLLLKKSLKKNSGIKFQISLNLHLSKFNNETQKMHNIFPWFQSYNKIIFDVDSIETKLIDSFNTIIAAKDSFIREGSGWFVSKILKLRIQTYKYSFWGGFKPKKNLPKSISSKKSIINFDVIDNKCFVYCILAKLYRPSKNRGRVKYYEKYLDKLNTKSISYPTKIIEIKKFEKDNNLTINVFGLTKNKSEYKPYPIYISINYDEKVKEHIDLLLYDGHYYLITNLNSFVGPLLGHSTYYCCKCLLGFRSKKNYDIHRITSNCQQNYTGQNYYLPPEKTFIKFKDYQKSIYAPFVIYADFESTILETNIKKGASTTLIGEHEVNAFGCQLVSKYVGFNEEPKIFVGKNVVHKFLDYLYHLRSEIAFTFAHEREPIHLTDDIINIIRKQKKCYLCGKKFDGLTRKYLDHSHFKLNDEIKEIQSEVNYSCNRCNLTHSSLRMKKLRIPVIFHNLTNYDMPHLIKKLASYKDNLDITPIPMSTEKYKSIYIDHFVFLDSYQFLANSLDDLSKILLKEGDSKFIRTKRHFPEKKYHPYVFSKGFMCYDYIDNLKKLGEKKLPERKYFYNKLTLKDISEQDYKHAVNMFDTFKCKTLGGYLKIYLKIDVLILSDIFEEFRKTTMKQYGLDPVHYLSASSLSYDSMLKFTGAKIKIMSEMEQYNFIERLIRGGVTQVANRWALIENPSEHILFVDANALYAYCMTQYLPYGDYHWLDSNSINKFDVMKISDTSKIGYILEVTLDYPEELHDLHNDFPLAPEKQTINYNDLSDYCKNILNVIDLKYRKSEKLLCTLNEKKKYVLHYRNLKLYLTLGLKIKKIHRILRFKQAPWMAPYIENNNNKRATSTSTFESNLYKLYSNSCFGKSIENQKKRINIKLEKNPKKIKRLISKPNFHSANIFEDLAAIRLLHDRVLLNKPHIVGAVTLELSKVVMMDFHYNKMLKIFDPENIKLIYSDTDSLAYKIKDKDMTHKLYENKHLFDFSNLSESNFLFNTENKKVLGKFKIEYGEKKIIEFIALRSKMYSVLFNDQSNVKHIKGIKKYTTNPITHENFREALLDSKYLDTSFYTIRSFKQKVYTCKIDKHAICPFDDKRWILADGINSLAYGHKKIKDLKRKKRKFEQ